MLFFLFMSPLASAQERKGGIQFQFGKLNGETDYTIYGEADGGWKSELIFPLDTKFITTKYIHSLKTTTLGIKNINLSVMKNLDQENNGIMKDSDWIYSQSENKIIYSESTADLDLWSGNLELLSPSKDYNQNMSYHLKLGYKYNNYDYNVHDVVQYNYFNNTKSERSGKVLAYEVQYHIPYLGVKVKNSTQQKLNWQIDLNLAPYVEAEDVDDHILRYKESTGETDGSAIIINGALNYNINSNLIFSLSGTYNKIDTEGYQEQYWYDGDYKGEKIKNIDHTIDLESYKIATSIKYLF